MSRPRLRLVHSSNDTEPAALVWQRSHGFRPLVLQGEANSAASGASVWDAGLELVHLALLRSCRNYVAFVQATIAVLDLCTNREEAAAWDFVPAERVREH